MPKKDKLVWSSASGGEVMYDGVYYRAWYQGDHAFGRKSLERAKRDLNNLRAKSRRACNLILSF